AAIPDPIAQGSRVVLVIDDEAVVRAVATKALVHQGYTVLVARDGMDAIEIFKQHPGNIDVAFLDLSMPGLSGEETLRELTKLRPALRVLVSSGYSEAAAMPMFHGQHVAGFIQKPYTAAGIVAKVQLTLN